MDLRDIILNLLPYIFFIAPVGPLTHEQAPRPAD